MSNNNEFKLNVFSKQNNFFLGRKINICVFIRKLVCKYFFKSGDIGVDSDIGVDNLKFSTFTRGFWRTNRYFFISFEMTHNAAFIHVRGSTFLSNNKMLMKNYVVQLI